MLIDDRQVERNEVPLTIAQQPLELLVLTATAVEPSSVASSPLV